MENSGGLVEDSGDLVEDSRDLMECLLTFWKRFGGGLVAIW